MLFDVIDMISNADEHSCTWRDGELFVKLEQTEALPSR